MEDVGFVGGGFLSCFLDDRALLLVFSAFDDLRKLHVVEHSAGDRRFLPRLLDLKRESKLNNTQL